MTRNTRMRGAANSWRYRLPEVAGPVGGGLLKIGHASTWAAVGVSLAPIGVVAALDAIFMIGYVPAVICYLCSGPDRQDAMARLISTSANAIVALLTLTPTECSTSRTLPADIPGLRVLKRGSGETSQNQEMMQQHCEAAPLPCTDRSGPS